MLYLSYSEYQRKTLYEKMLTFPFKAEASVHINKTSTAERFYVDVSFGVHIVVFSELWLYVTY